MKLEKLGYDKAAMEEALLAFKGWQAAGVRFWKVHQQLRELGMKRAEATRYIHRMEDLTGVQLVGGRPERKERAKPKPVPPPKGDTERQFEKLPGGKRYALKRVQTATRVIPCPKCGAPVVESERARLKHRQRMPKCKTD